jgi:hypothetical protein
MKTINDGGPAFPVPSVSWKEEDGKECVAIGTHGMTLRDYFAGQALAGITSRSVEVYKKLEGSGISMSEIENELTQRLSCAAYIYADAMLAAREGKQ